MSREILHEGNFKRFLREAGWEFTERLRVGGVVGILPISKGETVILVEQARIPVGKRVIEIPAGLANDQEEWAHETLEDAARRELQEETGYEAGKMELLFGGPIASASLTDIVHLFLATDLEKVSDGGGDESEDILVHEVSLQDIVSFLKQKEQEGFLVDPKIYSALYLYEIKKKDGNHV